MIAILGAGAIGGFLGARLIRAGADVVLIARGPHLQAMKESGMVAIARMVMRTKQYLVITSR